MIRIPATLVGLGLTIMLGVVSFIAASILTYYWLLFILWPLCTTIGGFVSGRLALRVPPVPGFAVGILSVAFQIGISTAFVYDNTFQIVFTPWLPILEIITAIIGGLVGTLIAHQANRAKTQSEQQRTPLPR